MVPKKGLEPPHPCGYMDLNHARLPIPPLRQVNYSAVRAALKEDTAASILTRHRLSVKLGPGRFANGPGQGKSEHERQ
jgi:hypothetical protein